MASSILRAAQRKLHHIHDAEQLGDLAAPPGNRLEVLRGNRRGQHSIKIDDPWRISFTGTSAGAENVEIVDDHRGSKVMARRDLPPIHAGERLREEFMKPSRLTTYRLAKDLDVPVSRIQAIVGEKRGITGDTALRSARCFGTTPEFWLNMQRYYELEMAEAEAGKAIASKVRPRAAA